MNFRVCISDHPCNLPKKK